MNANLARASMFRHVMALESQLEGNPQHNQHIREFCSYADAVAKGEADEVREEIPSTVQQEVQKQMDSRKVQIEVDKASVKTAKAVIDDLTKSIRNLFK